ncbi:MAG: aspartate--tRNA ligase [Clostridiaceae bacterium]|jgi:aspartyl-tRNA synthetase|nr:aspartate--tRNA ligase [Clostridiaceae bacterium]
MKRSEYCGLFNESYVNSQVTANGWVLTKRDMGGVIFIDLKDREGVLQTVFDANDVPHEVFLLAEQVKLQSVVEISGYIKIRGEETYNPKIRTGTIELKAEQMTILSECSSLPFAMDDEVCVKEELRLKYRYLDIRRSGISNNLLFRHKAVSVIRRYLEDKGFIEVETPILTKSTPEGARDYLVPSRVHPNKFYALPQSPQIFKQLLMVGGMDRYYQIARCFRDEDLRADRQPEFTQVDMEMSFVTQEDILEHLEKMFKHIMKQTIQLDIHEPFIKMTYKEAMDRYGTDKPDLRFDLSIKDLTGIANRTDFSIFKKAETVRAINYKSGASMTRSEIEQLTKEAESYGAKGMAWIAIQPDGSIYSILTKYISKTDMDEIFKLTDAKPGDFILFCADTIKNARRILGQLRLYIAKCLGLIDMFKFCFAIITDFPLFEYSEEEQRYVAAHHPFTCPNPEDIGYMLTDKDRIRALAYDIVLNGTELGSGSIRIHDSNVQKLMFEALGFTPEQIQSKFGFFVKAFSYGTPPHGGFAFGLDRLIMILSGASSLRDVIAFPKIKDGSCLMSDTPDTVEEHQLKILHISCEGQTDMNTKKHNIPKIPIEKLSVLAKLTLSEKEKKNLEKDMTDIIAFAGNIMDIDTSSADESIIADEAVNAFREDIALNVNDRENMLSNSKTLENGYIKVPKVIRKEA